LYVSGIAPKMKCYRIATLGQYRAVLRMAQFFTGWSNDK
jgi:hypothetical protein